MKIFMLLFNKDDLYKVKKFFILKSKQFKILIFINFIIFLFIIYSLLVYIFSLTCFFKFPENDNYLYGCYL